MTRFQYCSDDAPSAPAPTIGTVAQNSRPNSICLGRQVTFSSWLELCPSVQINLNQSKRPLFPVLFLDTVASLSLISLSPKLPIPPVNLLFLPAHGSHTVSILASLHTLGRWVWSGHTNSSLSFSWMSFASQTSGLPRAHFGLLSRSNISGLLSMARASRNPDDLHPI